MGAVSLKLRKQRLRLKQKSVIGSLTPAGKRVKSGRILSRLKRWGRYLGADRVLFFSSLSDEPDTCAMIQDALKRGKKVYLPAVEKDAQLHLYPVRSWPRDARQGAFGIAEPQRRKRARADLSEMQLAFIPGLAFDRKGRRLGRGQGFYDRLLKDRGEALCVGVGFQEHLVRSVPSSRRDRRVQAIITEKSIHEQIQRV